MKISKTVEDYLKQIFLASLSAAGGMVSLKEVARLMEVTPGTTTSMMKTLTALGLVDYRAREGVQLTDCGEREALKTIRRHRLIEKFLTEVLGLDWAEVHEEADALEHVVSDRILGRLDQMLGYPRWGPHGKPIPTKNGSVPDRDLVRLSELAEGKKAVVAEVEENSPKFLKYLHERGLLIGTALTLVHHDEEGNTVEVKFDHGDTVIMGLQAANAILVESA